MTPPTGIEKATLAEQLRAAPLPVSMCVRYALQLADALRAAHDRNSVAGTLDPEKLVLTESGIELQSGGFPIYAAPEVREGRPADPRADVFAFGCVFYRLLTGRDPQPGSGEAPPALGTVYDEAGPVRADQIGGLERLLEQCLAPLPENRLQRMQKVFLELKLLRVGSRHAEPALAARREKTESAIRAEIERVERSLSARVESCERTLVEVQGASTQIRDKLRTAVEVQQSLRAALQSVEANLRSIGDLTSRLQTGIEENARTLGCVEEDLSGRLNAIQEQQKVQAHSIEAMHTTMSQTDDLLERVVEAFDSLQATVLEHSEDRKPGAAS